MEIRNTFQSGMVQDAIETLANTETYRMARNAIHQSRDAGHFGLVNEESNELVTSFGGTIKGHSHIEERNQTLFFVYNGSSEIWLFDHRTNAKEFVCSDREFGCNWGFDGCEFLYGEFKQFNKCNELHVYWSSDCIYHVVNLDEMLSPDRKAAVKACQDCTYFDVFKATCGPHLSATPSYNAGSTMEGGTIQFAIQLEDNDGNQSNVFDISQPVFIETPDNVAGQIAKMSAKLTIGGLDKTWNDVIIYVIQTVGQNTVIKKMPSAAYGDKGFTFEYYGQAGQIVDVSTLINKRKAWLRGQDLLQHDGRMFYYNIKNERNLNYQKYANNISVEYVEYEVSMEQQLKYHFPSMMRGEVYALGIVWKYLDGTYSPTFHIPASGGGGGAGQAVSTAQTSSAVTTDNDEVTLENRESSGVSRERYCMDDDGNCVTCDYCEHDCQSCTPTGKGATGGTASGGAGSDGGASEGYNPMKVGDLNTDDQFVRNRNPQEEKDRPNESDKLETAVKTDIDNIDTNKDDLVDAGTCHDNLYGCDTTEAIINKDYDELASPINSNADLLSGFGKDKPDPEVSESQTLKQAAQKLMDDAVTDREYITRKRPTLSYSGGNQGGPGKSPEDPIQTLDADPSVFTQEGVGDSTINKPIGSGATIRGDNWVDSVGNPLTEEPPRIVSTGSTNAWTSSIQYPDDKDCNGDFFYPQGPIKHHQMPWGSEKPHFVSFQNGVVNKYQPENYEYGKTYTRPLGLRVTNIKFPDDDDLPKPLCPKSPFKIVYVKRTDHNKRVFAKGWLSGTFNGDVYGSNYAYPRHGVNSFEHVDRFISTGDGSGRMGSQSSDPIYTFHSPDTDCDNSFLPVTKVRSELALKGGGWMHGQWAEGKKPQTDQWAGTQKDNGGARVSNNLNHYDGGGGEVDVVGISYAPGNTVVTPASGMSLPLMNRFRESSVYLETSGNLAGDGHDKSFVGGTLDHFAPTECNAPYVALIRDIPDQYGSVDGLKYIDLGLVATSVHAQGTKAIEGLCGDVWIGPYSKRRTSYVSNKVGDFFNPPKKPGSPCRERSWCDNPDDKIFQYFGIDHYPTKLPKSGDKWDPKNYAGLHTVAGECGALGKSKNAAESAAAGTSESDFFGPRTLKSLVHCVVESHVNPHLRETGEGSQLQDGKVWYPKLKDLYLDPDAPNQHPWEETFMGRFYHAIEQPSKKQLAKKALIRTLLNLIAPAGMLTQFQNLESVVDTVSLFLVAPMLMAMWVLANNTLFTDRRLNQMLGIKDCKRDEEGGDLDELIENWEDAYCRYNWDYSKVNDTQPYYAFRMPYNTCDCDDCSKSQTTNEVYHSNKQNLDSEIDAYRNVKINNYNEIPAHAGKLQRLFVQGQGFYAHTSDGIWLLQLRQESIPNQIAFQQSGTGELLAEPQMLFEGVQEGYAGTQHPNAAINTAFGYFFVDDIAKKIYRFNGSPEEISAYGMFNFFKKNLGFCDTKACYDEKTQNGIHYALGWDPRHNRLLVTKQDGSSCNSFTASYTPIGVATGGSGSRGKWISLHDYHPQAYLWDRDNFYSIQYGSGQLWKHHKQGDYQTFYGELHPFEVWFSVVSPDLEAFDFEHLMLDTNAELETNEIYPVKDVDHTFNKVAIWNSDQGTGTLPIVIVPDNKGKRKSQFDRATFNYGEVRFNKVRRNWKANAIKDLILADCKDERLMIADCDCQPIPDINEEIFDCTVIKKQDFSNRNLSDKHLNFRYTLDDRSDMRLFVRLHKVYDQRKNELKEG